MFRLKQAHVLDRDHRLVGEVCDQLDLFVGEGLHLLPPKDDDADWRSFSQDGTPSMVVEAARLLGTVYVYSGSPRTSGT